MELDALAHAIADDGISAHEREIAVLTRALRTRATVRRMLLDLVADRSAPSVVRERALGRLLANLCEDELERAPTVTVAA